MIRSVDSAALRYVQLLGKELRYNHFNCKCDKVRDCLRQDTSGLYAVTATVIRSGATVTAGATIRSPKLFNCRFITYKSCNQGASCE